MPDACRRSPPQASSLKSLEKEQALPHQSAGELGTAPTGVFSMFFRYQ